MDDEGEDDRSEPQIPRPRASGETGQTIKFWDPPEVIGLVATWVLTVAVLLLGLGVGVLLSLTHTGGDQGGGTQSSHSSPASGGLH